LGIEAVGDAYRWRLLLVVLLEMDFKIKRGLQEISYSMVKSINCFELMYIITSNIFDLNFCKFGEKSQ